MTDTRKKTETTRSHEHELTIDAPTDAVWKAITDPEELVRWFPLHADVEPGEGGVITYAWGPELKGDNQIRIWEPGRRLRTTWFEGHPDGTDREALVVDWYLEGKGGQTTLRLVHSGFGHGADWDKEFDGTRRGWTFELRSLRHYLEHHRGKDRRTFWIRVPVDIDGAAVWERLTGPGGLIEKGDVQGLKIGEGYDITLSTGDRLRGTVHVNAPGKEFGGTVTDLDQSIVRFGFEDCSGMRDAHLWLSSWGLPPDRVAAIESRWDAAMKSLFA